MGAKIIKITRFSPRNSAKNYFEGKKNVRNISIWYIIQYQINKNQNHNILIDFRPQNLSIIQEKDFF